MTRPILRLTRPLVDGRKAVPHAPWDAIANLSHTSCLHNHMVGMQAAGLRRVREAMGRITTRAEVVASQGVYGVRWNW